MGAKMSSLIRIAAGQVGAYALLNTDSYLVSNWTRPNDMLNTPYVWSASQPDKPLDREVVAGLGIGTGGFYGGYFGAFNIFLATPLMRKYLFETIMQSKPIAPVTVYMQASNSAFESAEYLVLYGEMQRRDYVRFNDDLFHTIEFDFRRGVEVEATVLGLADGVTMLALSDGVTLLALGAQ